MGSKQGDPNIDKNNLHFLLQNKMNTNKAKGNPNGRRR
jgi:hypothetical protein